MRLQTINEALQFKGPVNNVYASLNIQAYIKSDGKVTTNVHVDVDSTHAQVNEPINRVKSDKLEAFQRDLRSIMDDAKKRIEKSIQKYDF